MHRWKENLSEIKFLFRCLKNISISRRLPLSKAQKSLHGRENPNFALAA